jgi:hypothetical protein
MISPCSLYVGVGACICVPTSQKIARFSTNLIWRQTINILHFLHDKLFICQQLQILQWPKVFI